MPTSNQDTASSKVRSYDTEYRQALQGSQKTAAQLWAFGHSSATTSNARISAQPVSVTIIIDNAIAVKLNFNLFITIYHLS